MLADFLFSIAGKKTHPKIETLIDLIVDTKALMPAEQQVFNHIKCADAGNYPSPDYFYSMGYEPINITKSIAEIAVLAGRDKGFLTKGANHSRSVQVYQYGNLL